MLFICLIDLLNFIPSTSPKSLLKHFTHRFVPVFIYLEIWFLSLDLSHGALHSLLSSVTSLSLPPSLDFRSPGLTWCNPSSWWDRASNKFMRRKEQHKQPHLFLESNCSSQDWSPPTPPRCADAPLFPFILRTHINSYYPALSTGYQVFLFLSRLTYCLVWVKQSQGASCETVHGR